MLVRLVFSFIIGLIAAMPRDRNYIPIDITPPPGAGESPTPDYLPGDGPISGTPIPAPGDLELPPTPPPGFEGTWPPSADVEPDVPPTPPPGFEGNWPGSSGVAVGPFREQLRDLLGQIRSLLRSDTPVTQQADAIDQVRDGAVRLQRGIDVADQRPGNS